MVHKFSEFADEHPMSGKKIPINEVLNCELTVKGYRVTDSSKNPGTKCLTISVVFEDIERVIFTGSTVLIDQCEKYKDQMPFEATIKKIDNYYTFS